ncbi:ABC transporter permease subunit [Paucibacter sp. KCTC 42545]|uniref:ABC transporter permease subunit n=1 Tax=Paucibacter sp. KCTC 42545 TaxID=1768242 RepID=UPI000733BF4A|nr:ABC transporter permease subunit [Paucibacter sp. KCTC 42545]ALT79037.1 peptide transporter [Paucibacter sp. KCTC 42545]
MSPADSLDRQDLTPLAPHPTPLQEFWRGFSANRGALAALLLFSLIALASLLAPWLAPHSPIEQFREHMLVPPVWAAGGSSQFLLGTDELGRCMLSRLLYGGRVSMGIGLASVLLSLLPGVLLGLLAAFYQRLASPLIMRVMDIMLALPGLLLAICVITILGPGLINTVIAIAIGALPGYTRLTRAAALAEIGKDYVTASRVAGAGNLRLMFDAVLPNCMAPLIVNASLSFSSAILETAGLGFLGLGVQAPTPEWGTMLSAARDYIQRAPWVVTLPGLTILITVLSINLMGDGLRDALDPKLKKVG